MVALNPQLARRLTAAAVRELDDITTTETEAAHLAVSDYDNSEPGTPDHDAAYRIVLEAMTLETECDGCGDQCEWEQTVQEQDSDGEWRLFCLRCCHDDQADEDQFRRDHSARRLG